VTPGAALQAYVDALADHRAGLTDGLALVDREIEALQAYLDAHGRFRDGGELEPGVELVLRFIERRTEVVGLMAEIDGESVRARAALAGVELDVDGA